MKRFGVVALVVAFVVVGLFGTPPAGAVNRAKVRRPGPIRVLLMGDSMTYFSQDRVQPLLGPAYQVITGGIAGQSLLDQDVCDGTWARQLVALYDPDVVVLEYLGTYKTREFLTGAPGSCVYTPYGSPLFYKRWTTSARLQQRILRTRGARVIWAQMPKTNVGPPIYIEPIFNAIYAKVAGKQAQLLDVWTPFGGDTYNPSMHIADGVHFSTPGNIKYTALVADAVRG